MWLLAIKAEGGITFAQDDTNRYDSMPRSASGTEGCASGNGGRAEPVGEELGGIDEPPK